MLLKIINALMLVWSSGVNDVRRQFDDFYVCVLIMANGASSENVVH